MISVIICHVNKELLVQIEKNILETIGVEYELVIIENHSNNYNIFQAYNEGIKQSKFPILCFVHEDVLFHTLNWGLNLLKHFEDNSVGLVGTIGGTAFPNCPAPWWNNNTLNKPHLNLIQHWKHLNVPEEWNKKVIDTKKNIVHQYFNPFNKSVVDAVTLDGVFMCARKELFAQEVFFDDKTFTGFHCYDTDICFQVINAGYRVVIVFDILLEHLSLGTININWTESAENLADKWKGILPLFTGSINKSSISLYHYKALLTYSYWEQGVGYTDKKIRINIKKYFRRAPLKLIYKEALLLWLWMKLGYKVARYPYAILKRFFK